MVHLVLCGETEEDTHRKKHKESICDPREHVLLTRWITRYHREGTKLRGLRGWIGDKVKDKDRGRRHTKEDRSNRDTIHNSFTNSVSLCPNGIQNKTKQTTVSSKSRCLVNILPQPQ